jgi:hypothetical protein
MKSLDDYPITEVIVPPAIVNRYLVTSRGRRDAHGGEVTSYDPRGEERGSLGEHGVAHFFHIDPSTIRHDRADNGWDLVVEGVKIEVKSSGIHPVSWLVSGGDIGEARMFPKAPLKEQRQIGLFADWFVFCYVVEPATVYIKGMMRLEDVAAIPLNFPSAHPDKHKRLIHLFDAEPFDPDKMLHG